MRTQSPSIGQDEPNRRTQASRFSERQLVIYTGTALWVVTTVIVVAGSFFPALAPENVNFWRVVLGVPAISIAVLALVLGMSVPGKMVYPLTFVLMMPGLLANAILVQITPATEAILLNMLVTVMFAGYFMRPRELAIALATATAIALGTLFTELPSDTDGLQSWLAVYLPTMFTLAFVLHMQKRSINGAIAEASARFGTDPLTGVGNLRALREHAERELDVDALLDGSVTGLLLIDLDNFKSANTLHGHMGGDRALECVADHLDRVAPDDAVVARVGGDEFAVLMRAGSIEELRSAALVLRGAVQSANTDIALPGVSIDASIGLATFPEDGANLDDLLSAADRAMYAEKRVHHERPERLIAATDPEPVRIETIISAEDGRILEFLRSRTRFASATALGWFAALSTLAIGLAIPDATDSHLSYMLILIVAGVFMAGLLLAINPTARSGWHAFYDVLTLIGIGTAAAATGGAMSPALSLLLLVIVSQAWFWKSSHLALRATGIVVVGLSPAVYEGLSGSMEFISGMTVYTLLAVGLTLGAVLFFNQTVLDSIYDRTTRLSLIDPLTGIANRRAFAEFVDAAIGSDPDMPGEVAIVMIDLDNFKDVNTDLGHHAGDVLLIEIAHALNNVARSEDCLARVGGDEFAAVLRNVGVDGAKALAERFVSTVAGLPAAKDAGVTASAGFALCPLHGRTIDELISAADSALMSVKSTSKGDARVGRIVAAV